MIRTHEIAFFTLMLVRRDAAKASSVPSDGIRLRVRGGTVMSEQVLSVMTTSWDDGHPLDIRIADLLASYGLTGTFYVPKQASSPVMSAVQIRDLSSRFEIGSHLLEHRMLDQLTDEQAREQLSGSRGWVEQVTGKPCRTLCFPWGRYRHEQLSLVREAGYLSARTTELLSTAFPRRVEGLALLSTTVQAYPHSPLAYTKNALKRRSLGNLMRAGALFYRRTWLQLAGKLLERTLSRGGVFHLWGHSWEIEQERQWGRLEELLAVVAANKDRLTIKTNSELESYALS
jgi:peptidoglycan/xylan/chitin deacetylase (PgdA/CDA1 family)